MVLNGFALRDLQLAMYILQRQYGGNAFFFPGREETDK